MGQLMELTHMTNKFDSVIIWQLWYEQNLFASKLWPNEHKLDWNYNLTDEKARTFNYGKS